MLVLTSKLLFVEPGTAMGDHCCASESYKYVTNCPGQFILAIPVRLLLSIMSIRNHSLL